MTLSKYLKLLRKHGIWFKIIELNQKKIVFTRTKTVWFAEAIQ